MDRHEQLRYELFGRVTDFGVAHRDRFPETSTAGQAFAAVAAAAAGIQGLLTDRAAAVAEGRKMIAATRADLISRLADITRAARLVARNEPGAEGLFKPPATKTDAARLATARAFIRERQTAMERFGHLGMPASLFAELEELVERFEQAGKTSRAALQARAATRAAISSAVARGFDAVKVLDVAVPFTIEEDPGLLARWNQARRVAKRTRVAPAPIDAATASTTRSATSGAPEGDDPAGRAS